MYFCDAPPLTAPYDGPYKVASRNGRVLKILMKVDMVTADRVKSAHIDHEPETCSRQKRQMQPKPISTAKTTAVITRKPRTARARSRSMIA